MRAARIAAAAAGALAAIIPATTASAAPAIPYTAPGGTYLVSSDHHTMDATILSNPSHYNVQVKIVCLGGTYYSVWSTSGRIGASCHNAGDSIAQGTIWYDKTHHYVARTWVPGQALSGSW